MSGTEYHQCFLWGEGRNICEKTQYNDKEMHILKLHRCEECNYLKQPWADYKSNSSSEPPDLAGQFHNDHYEAMIPGEDD